jgi:hypothetical protein
MAEDCYYSLLFRVGYRLSAGASASWHISALLGVSFLWVAVLASGSIDVKLDRKGKHAQIASC